MPSAPSNFLLHLSWEAQEVTSRLILRIVAVAVCVICAPRQQKVDLVFRVVVAGQRPPVFIRLKERHAAVPIRIDSASKVSDCTSTKRYHLEGWRIWDRRLSCICPRRCARKGADVRDEEGEGERVQAPHIYHRPPAKSPAVKPNATARHST